MQFLLHITCSCIPHAYALSFQYTCYIWIALELFWLYFFLSPFLLFTLVVSMAPKRKSALSQNPLHPRTSSSSDPTPSHIRIHDEDAWKDFSENFSRRDIHSERQVVLLDFANTDISFIIRSRGWESLCDVPITCPLVLIQEFYFNMHGIDHSVPLFFTRIRGTRIPVTP